MDRLRLMLVVLLGLTQQVFTQTIQVDDVVVTMLEGSGTYIEAEAAHEFIFDVAITLAPGMGADDASVEKWQLQVELDTNPTAGTPAVVAGSTKMLSLNSVTPSGLGNTGLTLAQANLPIPAGTIGIMQNVRVTFDLSDVGLTAAGTPEPYLCPDLCPDDDATAATDTRYRLKVTLLPGNRGNPANPYTINGAASTRESLKPLTCIGAVLNVVPVIKSGVLKENMANTLIVDVLVTSEANGRTISPSTTEDIWNLKFTLEKTKTSPTNAGDRDVIEVADVTSGFTGIRTGINPGGSIILGDVSVPLNLETNADDGTEKLATNANAQTTCGNFDFFCVELERDPTLADPNKFTFSGSESINTDATHTVAAAATKNPKKCVSIQCNGLLIDSVSLSLTAATTLCQGRPSDMATINRLSIGASVTLNAESAPLVAGNVRMSAINPTAAGKDIWQIALFGSSTADCTATEVQLGNLYGTGVTFSNMVPGQPTVLPTASMKDIDLTNHGCPQIQYICGQLYRNYEMFMTTEITNADFTYGFTNPAVSSTILTAGTTVLPFTTDLNTPPVNAAGQISSQWGLTAVDCKGVTLNGMTLTMNAGYYIGEYTEDDRIDFDVTFVESNPLPASSPDCFVQGSDLWELEAFVAVGNEGTAVTDTTAKTLRFADVPLENVQVTTGAEDQDITTDGGMLTFTSATAVFDFSKLDCQQGPFAFCVELKKSANANPDFTLEPAVDPMTHVKCAIPAPCVGAELEETTIMQAQAPMFDSSFPIRQGVAMHDYYIDVGVKAKSGSGSIAIPDSGFPAVIAGVTRGEGSDLWDMDVFLATDNQGGGQVTPIAVLDDRCGYSLPDHELQAGQPTSFESVRVPLDTSTAQCSEFSHMCVTVKHGASHNQDGSLYVLEAPPNTVDTIRKAPTIEGNVANVFLLNETPGTCSAANIPTTADVPIASCAAFTEAFGGGGRFCDSPATRPVSAATTCMPVTCVGVRIQSISCSIRTDSPGGAPTMPSDGVIKEGESGYFHLGITLLPDSNAGGVIGTQLWAITVFLSPYLNGSVETVAQSAVTDTAWADANIVPGLETTFDVYTAFNDAGRFMFDYPCEEIQFLCVKIEKGAAPKADNTGTTMDFKIEDDSVMINCKTVPSCGGVVLNDMTLALDATMSVTEKQLSTENNELTVDVGLVFNAASAEFTPGTDFWDIDFFLAEDSAGNTKIVDAKNAADFDHLTAAVDAGATIPIADQMPQFDLTDKTCRPVDATHANPYMYLCATVKKNTGTSPAPSPDFSLSPGHWTTCIEVKCEGVIFTEPQIISATGGPVFEAEMNNAITVAMRFPIQLNGGQVAANYPSNLWRVTVFLSPFENGLPIRYAEKDVALSASEIRSPVQSALVFSNKQVSLDYFGITCPAGGLFICVQIRELENATPDCTIDTAAGIKCQKMECRAVKFTGADLTFDPELCLVEHKALNLVKFNFKMSSEAGYASITAPPGSDLWQVSAYGSVSQAGEGINQFGLNQTIFETSLRSGVNLDIEATLQLNLENFVCPDTPLYMCVQLDKNPNSVPDFSFAAASFNPRRSCKIINCKGVKMTNIAILKDFNAVTERSGPTTITSDIRVHTDENYAGVEGSNLWAITGELRDPGRDKTMPGDGVILSTPVTLSSTQSSEGLVPGSFTTFNAISVNFDLNRNVPCPAAQHFDFCVKFAKGAARHPDFSIDDTSVTEACKEVPCRGVCISESAVSFHEDDAYVQEGVSTQEVHLDATYVSDAQYAGIDEQEARKLWKVKVFASPDGSQRVGETDGMLATNNDNYPLKAGGKLQLTDITATLDFSAYDYVTCLDAKYICVELMRDPASVPAFSLFGCPSTRLVHCAVSKCRGVLLEDVTLTTVPSPLQPRENTQSFSVNFGLRLTPHNGAESKSSILPNGGANSNYWEVELFASKTNPPENWSAKTIATIPTSELMKGIPDIMMDTSLSGLTANMDLSNTFCGNFAFLCARVKRGAQANPKFTLNGFSDDNALVGCTTVNCEGVDIDSATVADLKPDCVVEGNNNYKFSYDASFVTNSLGGGVFGSNLWRLRTFLATAADGSGEIDIDGDSPENAVYPTLPAGSESQTLTPGQSLGFQNVEGSFDTRNFMCPANGEVYLCVRLEKDESSNSAFTLSSPVAERQMCTKRPCKGVTIARDPPTDATGALVIKINPDRTIITEREADQEFELDIIATTAPDTGSISGTNLWEIDVFFNDKADGTGMDYGSTVKADLEEENANRAVASGGNLQFTDVGVKLSAANLLCGTTKMYMCVRLSRNATSVPAFTLNPDPIISCEEITCNPVIITSAECKKNAPNYLLENVNNPLNFEFRLTSANVSASIAGTNLWSLNRVYTNDMENGMGTTIKVNQLYTTAQLTQAQRDRRLDGGNSLILPDVRTFLDLSGMTCANIKSICVDFGKSATPAPTPEFTLSFQGSAQPPWCKPMECRGVRANKTELVIDTASVKERTPDQKIIFDVTLYTDAGAASISGTNLWTITPSFEDSKGNAVASNLPNAGVPLGTVDRSLTAGVPLNFSNIEIAQAGLQNVVCPKDGLYLCVVISKNAAPSQDFTLEEEEMGSGALKDCAPLPCTGVQFTKTETQITSGREIDEAAASATHVINFGFEAVSRTSTTPVAGTKLWKLTAFGSRKEDGSGARHLEKDLTLSQPQTDQDLVSGAPLPFNGLSVTFDMRGVRCIDFQYFCTEISRDPGASLDFSIQGIDEESTPGSAVPDQKVLIDCQKMQCQGVYITIFGVSPDPPDSPPVLLENKDDQVFIIDAYIESDVAQQDVTGANLWAMKAFFNPSPNCDAIDDMGNYIRLLETDAVIFGGEDDQSLMKGGSINFNNVRVELDFQDGTCASLGEATYMCFEIIRSQHATPAFTLLGNNLRGLAAECKGVEVLDTKIVDASWTPQQIIERHAAPQRRKRQANNALTFDLDVQVTTNVVAAGVIGDNMWKLYVYLSGDEECASVTAATMVTATLTNEQANQDLLAGGILLFDINGLQVPFENVLCENARFVCVKLAQGDNPTNMFTLEGAPDESSLVGAYPLDCKGVRIINSQLSIDSGVPLIAGDPNHQLVFSFQINTAPDAAGISGTNLFSLFIYGNDQEDGFGKRAGDGYLLAIEQEVTIAPGVPNSFAFRPALLNLQGVSCEEIPYVCVQIFENAVSKPQYTLQPSDPASPVFTDCVPVACSGVHIDNLVLDFQSGLPVLEGSPTHQVHFIIKPTASITGASAVGDKLWEADIFINSQENGSGPKIALTKVNIIDNNVNLNKGTSIDLLANAVLDLTEFVCVRGQYICVDLRKGPEADPDFTLGGVMRACHYFTCKGVDFMNPSIELASNVVLRMLTSNTHVEFDAYIDAATTSSSVSGSNLFKVSVFASANSDGVGERYGESYADVSESANVGIVAGARSLLDDVKAYLDLTGVYCSQLKYVCIEIWKGDYANPDYQIDSPAGREELRVCQQASCYGVQINEVEPQVTLGSPLIENAQDITTWINIELKPSHNSASIVGDNLWKATCYANSRADGSGIRYSVQNAILQQSELDKDLLYSSLLYTPNPDPLVLENALVSMDYSSRHCSEIEYVCCTIGENENANPDFTLQGAYGNDNLLTGCTLVPCLGVGVTSTRLQLEDLEILKGDEAHTFSGDVISSIWRHSRGIQEDNTWAMSAYVLDNDHNRVAHGPVELIQQQQDLRVLPGNDLEFHDLNFQMNLAGLECFQIAYVCVELTTQTGVSFTLKGVHDSGELHPEALVGCSPHLQCRDFAVDIQVIEAGERHIEIEWNEGEGDFDTYVITYAPEAPRLESPQYIPRQLRAPLRFDGLTPGQEYTFNLYLYKGGVVKAGPVVEVERTKPAKVDVTISRQTNSELHVQWTEADGIYDTYIVELYPQGTPPTPLYVDSLARRELIFSGLREAREYTVTIYTAVGGRNGYRSEPGYASEITEPAAPFLELDLADPGTTHVDLKWTPPSGYRVEGFKLTSEPHEPGTNLPAELGNGVNSFRVTGLMPGREYEFHLVAYALVGNGLKIYSDPSEAHARTHPAPVTHADVEIATINSIIFTWEPAAGDVDSYRIHFNEQNGPDKTISAILPRRHTEGNLALATQYEFIITTISGGLESEEFHFYASTRPNRPGVIRPENVDVDLIHIMWEPAPGPSEGYEVTYSPTHHEYQPASPYFTTSTEFTLSGLHPHTTIDFEVRNVVRGMKSDPQEWRQRTFPDLPGEVEDLTIEASGPSSVVLRFSQPEYPNGLITAYIVSYEGRKPGVLGVDSGLFTITALPNEHDFEREIGNLRSGYTYAFRVRAANSEGQGESVDFQGLTLYAGLPLLAEKWYDPTYNYFAGVEPGAYTIDNVPIDAAAFSDINGEIVGYAIIVIESGAGNQTAPPHPPSYNQANKYEHTPAYQTEPIKTIDEFAQSQSKRSILHFVYYDVGADKDCPDQPVDAYYCNGPLKPLTTYRVAVRAFTEAGYVQTPWSHEITTSADRWWFAYAAIPFLFVVFVLAIILALLACSASEKNAPRRRKYQNKYQRDDFTDYGADNYNENVNMNASGSTIFMLPTSADPPLSVSGDSHKGKLNPTHVLGTRPVQISKFQQHVETMAANNAMKFVEEYENLRPIGDDLARLMGGLPEHKDKNRFSNILPYDYNRVQLTKDTYINASFIGGFNSRHEYIASQGPMSNTVDEFWGMVWENNSPTIVMMGRCVEDGHMKSEQYWPEADQTVTYGNLTITMVSEKVDNDWTIRDFTIQSGSEIRAVRQFNFTAWPNHGVPEKTDGVVRFVSTVRAEAPQHSGPMIIHCGAGIGRTGIFLALDILMQGLVYDETTVDVYGTVSSLRKQRCCMVQTVHQYIFLHKAMLDVLQGKASGYNWLLRTRKGSVVSRDSDQMTSDTM